MPTVRDLSQRWWIWVVGLAALSLGAVFRNQPGDYVIDNRFEQYWNPGRRLSRTFTIWDGSRGLGWVREEFWPGATLPIAVFRYFGASPALAEHLWHATLLTVAGTGCVALLRCFRPVLGWEHLLAALVYMFGPFSAMFLLPSNLYLHHALTPWLTVTVHRGLIEERPWRAAAGFALLVGLAGNLDSPGLLYAVVPLALVLLYDVFLERRTPLRRALGWVGRALVLTVGVSAAALAKTVIGAEALSQRLESTETPQVVALSSSWSESWRGLGFWVSYLRDAAGPIRPSVSQYLTVGWLALLTFVPAVIGIGALWWTRRPRRETLLYGSIAVAGVFLMVGPHPSDHPSPWGRAWLWTLENVSGTAAVRSTYKAGIAATLGLATLFGLGAIVLAARATSTWLRALLGSFLAVVLLAGAAPFWTGTLYHPDARITSVPAYWTDAMAWLDRQPGDSQVLVLPGATRAVYRWGWAGDDIHDALMDRAHLVDTAITVSPPVVADLLFAIDEAAADPAYQAGTLAPILRRLGIGYVVLRNDLDWRLMGVPRPLAFERLRADPVLDLAATFGSTDRMEGGLPPVEVFALRDPAPRARVVGDQPWILYSGGGAAWPSMAVEGVLDGDAPLAPTATQDADALAAQLERGSQLVVTDSNRRTAAALYSFSEERSRLLAEDEDLDRPALDLYRRAGSQTVATFGDATSIDDPGLFRSLAGFQPQFRPSRAFDGDLTTGWVAKSDVPLRERSLRVELVQPEVIDRLEVTAFDPRRPDRAAEPSQDFAGVPRIGRFAVDFSDGSTEYGNLLPGAAELEFPARRTTSLEIRFLDRSADEDVGIAEVDVPGLDLVERVRLPDDVFRASEDSAALRAQLVRAPVTYLFTRAQAYSALGGIDVEAQLLRQLRVVGDREYEVSGTLHSAAEPSPLDDDGCVDVGLEVDGRPVPVRGRGEGTSDFEGCEPLTLETGWHEVAGTGTDPVDRLRLSAGTPTEAGSGSGRPSLLAVDADVASQRLTVDAPEGAWVLPGIGYDERWHGSLDGVDLGPAVLLDGQVGWFVPPSDNPVELTATFGPESIWRVALGLTAVSVAVATGVLLRPRRRR